MESFKSSIKLPNMM